jgi:hypothetical protein
MRNKRGRRPRIRLHVGPSTHMPFKSCQLQLHLAPNDKFGSNEQDRPRRLLVLLALSNPQLRWLTRRVGVFFPSRISR